METQRLRLRQWELRDEVPFSLMGADPEVMRFFPSTLSREESAQLARSIAGYIDQQGWGFWAVELKETQEFIGFVGLHRQGEDSGIPNAPLIEIGWRIARSHWRRGYAFEAAHAALQYAFDVLGVEHVYSFTALANLPSQRLMVRLGMTRLQDFDHPRVSSGHPLERHCLFVIDRAQYGRGSLRAETQSFIE